MSCGRATFNGVPILAPKPKTREGYPHEQTRLVEQVCLFLSAKLGDLLDEMVLVGGLVPKLLIHQAALPADDRHPGSGDVDIGLALQVLEEERYKAIAERLRDLNFEPDRNDRGRKTPQRWKSPDGIQVDFLIAPTDDSRAGTVKHLESDFGALVAPGLDLAFVDFELIELVGTLPGGGHASRQLRVCGPGAFVVLKALAFHFRSENKDAYDLYYVVRNWKGGTGEIAARINNLRSVSASADACIKTALEFLRADFATPEHDGPVKVAYFLGRRDPDIQADAFGYVAQLLDRLEGD